MEAHRDDVFVVNKGKRSKRQRSRSLSPAAALLLRHLPALTPSSSSNSGDLSDEDFEEDMANCLILLANGSYDYGHRQTMSSSSSPEPPPESYKCKTCSKSFPSFQALGGHRASHKNRPHKLPPATPTPPSPIDQDQKSYNKPKKSEDHFRSSIPYESTHLSLQISSRSSFSSSGGGGQSSNKPRVHECSICGAEFASGQALGGHMRRHRPIPAAATSRDHSPELKRPKSALPLDLNLPAPEDDDRLESKIPFSPKEQVIVFSASSLVDCHF